MLREWNGLRLSAEQIKAYNDDGYLAGVRLLTDGQVDVLRGELAKLVEPECENKELFYEYHSNESTNPEKILFHALGAWRVSSAFHDLLWNAGFLMPASQLLDGAIRSCGMIRISISPPGTRSGGMASGLCIGPARPMAHLSCWLAWMITPTRSVHYGPGSHRWNLFPITALADDLEFNSDGSDKRAEAELTQRYRTKEGESLVHHPLMVPGSFENRTDRPRRATVINVFSRRCCFRLPRAIARWRARNPNR